MKTLNIGKKLCLFGLVGALSFGSCAEMTLAASSSAKKSEANVAFRYFLQTDQVVTDNACSTKDNLEFAVIDINHDGVKELVTSGDQMYHACVYAYVDDEVKMIDSSFSGDYVWFKNKNLVFSCSAHSGYYPESYAKFKNGKMVVLANAEGQDYIDSKGDLRIKYKYYIGGKKTTAKKYKAYVKKLKKGAKAGKISLYANTEANRKNYLK